MRWLVSVLILSMHPEGQSQRYAEMAARWADRYGVERELVHALIEAESAWDPNAVSSAGAVGLMQLMPDTAASLGVSNRFDPSENVRGGVTYLAWLLKRYRGDRRLAIASYNAGHARLDKSRLRYSQRDVVAYVNRVAYLYRHNCQHKPGKEREQSR